MRTCVVIAAIVSASAFGQFPPNQTTPDGFKNGRYWRNVGDAETRVIYLAGYFDGFDQALLEGLTRENAKEREAFVVVALYLAERVERVSLKVRVGLMEVVMGDGTPFQRPLGIGVTNVGERPVTINTVGWAIGKGKTRRYAVQPLHSPHRAQCPIELVYGKYANFMVSFLWCQIGRGILRPAS